MGKIFSALKSQASSLLTLFAIFILGAYYFFIYIPNNEKTVQARHFRCLQNIDKNIRDKINGSVGLLANILTCVNNKHDDFATIVKGYAGKKGNWPFDLLTDSAAVLDTLKSKPLGLNNIYYTTRIKVDAASQQLFLFVIWKNKAVEHSIVGLRFQFDNFIEPLLPPEIFNGYIVFVRDVKIYESFSTGLNYPANAKDSLLSITGKITTPGVREFKIGGGDYRAFSQPAFTYTGDQWIISGLVSGENYQKEKNQLPVGAVEFLLILVIIMLVSLPWIKLYHMGNKDRLSVSDGIASLLVSMIMMSLLFFVFFNYNPAVYAKTLCQPNSTLNAVQGSKNKNSKIADVKLTACYTRDEYSRNMLASKIITAFENEIDSAYLLLKAFDQGCRPETNSIIHVQNVPDEKVFFESNNRQIKASQMAWLDSDGDVVRFLTNDLGNDVDIPMNTNLRDRAYFKNVAANRFNKTTPYKFYLDQVISRSSNLFESIIAIPSDSDEVAVMSFHTNSLENVIMPDGFSFAIIDGTGTVLYHSMKERNLNENLKEEFADSTDLASCLEAKSDTSFSGKYYGRLYNVKIKPFPDMPYFAVILEDKEYIDSRNTQPYVFTLGMLICILIYMVLQFAVIFFASAKRSFFKKQWYDISWVGPKVKSHQQYNLAILFNLIIVILLTLFFTPDHFLRYVYILLFSVTFVSVFLNAIFAKSYKRTSPYLHRFKAYAIFWLSVFIVLIDVFACITLRHWELWCVFVYEAVIIAIGVLLYYFGRTMLIVTERKLRKWNNHNKLKRKANNNQLKRKWNLQWNPEWTYTQSFAFMTVTRLIITSGIPVAFFFICSFNYEVRLDTRYRQLKFGKALTQRADILQKTDTGRVIQGADEIRIKYLADSLKNHLVDSIRKSGNDNALIAKQYNTILKQGDSILIAALAHQRRMKRIDNLTHGWGIYSDLLYVNAITDTIRQRRSASDIREDQITRAILSAFRFHVNDIETRNNNMNLSDGGDSVSFSRLEPGNHAVKNTYSRHLTRTLVKIDSTVYLKLSSGDITYGYPAWWWWLILSIAIIVFYFLVHRIIRKLFALDLPSTEQWDKIDHDLVKNNDLNNLLFIVGSPGSRKLHKLRGKIKAGDILGYKNAPLKLSEDKNKGNVHIADMILIPSDPNQDDQLWGQCKLKALDRDTKLVIINHFEYNIKDANTNRAKLSFLESLMHQDSSKIIIISTVHPVSFLDSFSDSDSDDEKSSIPQNELERWHVLLGHYRIVIEPLTDKEGPKIAKTLPDLIKAETRYSYFMNKMRDITLDNAPKEYRDDQIGPYSDSLIFKLQITSQYFYTYIWQSLTKEEKLLLYDLAEDGLVNSYDSHNLSMLKAKGLIIKDNGSLTLFNKGFRNFILTAIGTAEAKRIKDQVKDTGNWGTLKTPLNLVILAILFFLILSQQESYSRIITYITTVGAGFTAILRIFPSLGANETQKTQ